MRAMKLFEFYLRNRKSSRLYFILVLLLASNYSFSQIKEEWVKKFNGLAVDMVVDGLENTYLTGIGIIEGSTEAGIVTRKYDKDGNLKWTKLFKNSSRSIDAPEDIAVDKFGNIYVAGWTDERPNDETNQVFVTLKYNSEGNQEWVRLFDTTGSEYDVDVAHSIAVDNAGNVYVTGESIGALTIKYNSQGEKLWVKSFKPPEGGVLLKKTKLTAKVIFMFLVNFWVMAIMDLY
jgi:hypothetical protein